MGRVPQTRAISKDLTYENIIQGVLEQEPQADDKAWDYHIRAAETLLKSAYFNRMAVAEIAIRACIIKAGGDRHSTNFKEVASLLTLRAFAEAVGMLPNTLYLWVSIKTEVFDRLNVADRDVFQHNAGEKTYKSLGKKQEYSEEVVQTVYQRFATLTPEQKATHRTLTNIRSIKKFFCVTEYWNYMTDDQVEAARNSLAQTLKRILEIQDMKRSGPKRKSRAKPRAVAARLEK